MMLDALGREINYMRISITDRCNLRCAYCMPAKYMKPLRHNDIMRYEEILKVVKAAVALGIVNFKVTGGEPLQRKGCVGFLRELKNTRGVESVTLTTNGLLLEPFLRDISWLDGINISLDSLDAATYKKITGLDCFSAVWRSFSAAMDIFPGQIKVNCVPLRGLNESEIPQIARLPVDVRFIEYMPTGGDCEGLSGAEILARLKEAFLDFEAVLQEQVGFGPARYYRSAAFSGRVGIIDAMENCFCAQCNRVRLSSEGFLKLCLFHDKGIYLRNCEDLEEAMRLAIFAKPERYAGGIRHMSHIGG